MVLLISCVAYWLCIALNHMHSIVQLAMHSTALDRTGLTLTRCVAYWLITWGTQHAKASFVVVAVGVVDVVDVVVVRARSMLRPAS